ncbi:MAG: hypothetical protein ACRDFB_01635 [Rhabdochlamydiaceae bacterium]
METPDEIYKWADKEVKRGKVHPARIIQEVGVMVYDLWICRKKEREVLIRKYQNLLRPEQPAK